MPVFMLSNHIDADTPDYIKFPSPHLARYDGLLCVGGDLTPQRLIKAYQNGIFPWFSEGDPILWWSPDPRLVLYPNKINISKSLSKKIKKSYFAITMDIAFEDVILACSRFRGENRKSTWLVDEMVEAYIELHNLGYAHSVDVWRDGKLVGGLYGVALGQVFFGESMFSYVSDASKVALVALCSYLRHHEFHLIDCQITSAHLISMGAEEISRRGFLRQIKASSKHYDVKGKWQFGENAFEDI